MTSDTDERRRELTDALVGILRKRRREAYPLPVAVCDLLDELDKIDGIEKARDD